MEILVKVADHAVATAEATLVTIGLGSCVAIMLYEPVARVGGLAHVLLPSDHMARDRSNRAKFALSAVPLLVGEMVKLGAQPRLVTAKLVGGASMFATLLPSGGINVGERNIQACRQALSAVNISVLAEDVGGDYGRSVYFHLKDGSVDVRSLKRGNRVL